MSDWRLPWGGGCRCGEVRFCVTSPPMLSAACHCTGCQKMTASAFTISLGLSTDGFEVTKGEPVLGGLRAEPEHYHCPACKSWMFTKPSAMPGFVNLRATMLDDHAWVRPFVDFHRREGFDWAQTGAKYSFEQLADGVTFQQVLKEYPEEGARP